MNDQLVFLKLGGSLITDKTRPYHVRQRRVTRLAEELRHALNRNPIRLLLGHGSGSFGHWAARPYGTRRGVHSGQQWSGFAEVAAAASKLNGIVRDALIAAAVPAISFAPSASIRCADGAIRYMDTGPLHVALQRGLVPVAFGDVAFDDVRGGTIVSTEEVFTYLAHELTPATIVLLGDTPGVLGAEGTTIEEITPADLPQIDHVLGTATGADVTGGMAAKVKAMLRLVQSLPGLVIYIASGVESGSLKQVLIDKRQVAGTRISAD